MSQTEKVLAFIRAEIAAGRPFPTTAQIASHMYWKHPSSANDVMVRLVRKKHVERVLHDDGIRHKAFKLRENA
jgi:hypothetical protein